MKFLIILPMLLLYCSSLFSQVDNLTQVVAKARKIQISKVSYNIYFEFQKDSPEFEGNTVIDVELNHINSALRIDFAAKEVKKVIVNSVEIKDFKRETGTLEIPRARLKKKNSISISYAADFNLTHFRRYFDKADNKIYFYSNLEPFGAHHIFPCFDQPDLKAVYSLKVKAPTEWKIIHNEPQISQSIDKDFSIRTFKPTLPLSTYLFFIGGGDYQEWSDTYNGLPLIIYARRSMAKNVDVKGLFEVTKNGLKFFSDYFDMPYPFSKYVHIFVPDFPSSGMENPGAITISEKFLYEGKASPSKISKRDDLIFHEMAHIWFGDLVTMEWWNDLWLNESFASYFASVALERINESKKDWMYFLNMKKWAYGEDLIANTSHPVVVDVPDTLGARGSFNGITYAKGASSLKQLHYLVGDTTFRDGLRQYFKKYAFKNTTLKDFIASIDQQTEIKLDNWISSWLLSSGPSSIRHEFTCKNKVIDTFTIKQFPNHSKVLLPHKTAFGFFKLQNDKLKFLYEEGVSYENAVTVVDSLKGKACPDFVMPNYSDHDYAHFSLDEQSMKVVSTALTGLPDPLSRFQLWAMLEQRIKDGHLSPEEYFKYVENAFKHEDDAELLSLLIGINGNRITTFRDPYLLFLTSDQRKEIAVRLEKVLFNRIIKSEPQSNLKLALFNLYLLVARSPQSQARLYQYIKTGEGPPHLRFSQELRWATLQNLSLNKHPEAMKLNAEELKRDSSLEGQKMELVVRSSYPDPVLKETLWKFYLQPPLMPYTIMREGTEYIHSVEAPELSNPYLQKYFDKMVHTNWSAYDYMIDFYFYRLFPVQVCSKAALEMSEANLKKVDKNFNSYARRKWLLSHNELAQCVKIRETQTVSHLLK